jgi:hypothetical protein
MCLTFSLVGVRLERQFKRFQPPTLIAFETGMTAMLTCSLSSPVSDWGN